METERAHRGVGFFAYERGLSARARGERGMSPIFLTAAVAVVALVGVFGWQATHSMAVKNSPMAISTQALTGSIVGSAAPSASSTEPQDPISQIGNAIVTELANAYFQMQDSGTYSSSTVEAIGTSLAPYVAASISYEPYKRTDLRTDNDTSYERMLRYREDLRVSFAPLLRNTDPEYQIFASYVDTQDSAYLKELTAVAENYREAAHLTKGVVVPSDAALHHLGVVNALLAFAVTLDGMVAHADDPFASVALLRGYNQAEADVLIAFNALTSYYKTKHS